MTVLFTLRLTSNSKHTKSRKDHIIVIFTGGSKFPYKVALSLTQNLV